jgi:hypothetical protein
VNIRVNSTVLRATSVAVLLALPALLSAQRGQGTGAPPAGGGQGAVQGGAGGRAGGPTAAPRGRANQAPAGPVPRMANGKPDLSGLWANPYNPNMSRGVVDPVTRQPLDFPRKGEQLPDAAEPRTFDLPYTDWGLKHWKAYDAVKNGDYAGTCLPFGMSRNINSPHGVQIIHNPDALAFLFEQNTWHHWVPTRPDFKWPEDLPEAWNGYSVGRWDGDTLIIETSNFNGYTKLDTSGHPHSKQMKLINTFKRIDSNTMEHTVTVHDPKAYTRDWMNVRTWRIKPYPDVLMEYSCEENNLQSILEGAIKMWTPPTDLD